MALPHDVTPLMKDLLAHARAVVSPQAPIEATPDDVAELLLVAVLGMAWFHATKPVHFLAWFRDQCQQSIDTLPEAIKKRGEPPEGSS